MRLQLFTTISLTACVVFSSAAARPVPLNIEGKSIVLVRRPDPGFAFVTNSGVLAGALAASGPLHDMRPGHEMEDAGKQLAAEDQIDDPAVSLSDVLLGGLVDNYKLRLLNSTAVIVPDEKQLEDYRKRNQPDLIFEFYTEAWRTFYFLDFKHYDVWYYAKARLIDGRTGSVIRRAKCAHRPVKTPASPTLDELLAEHGVRLRAAIEAAKELCLATVRQEFGLPVSSDAQSAAPPPPPETPGVGSVVVQVCVDTKGYLTEEPTVVASSGQNQLDERAIQVAKSGSGKYMPPTKDGKAVPGCIKFRVKFDLKDSPPPSA